MKSAESIPISLGTQRELFVDEALIERMEGAELRLQSPVPREPVLLLDQPWERGGYITTFWDLDRFRMYYMGHSLRDADDPDLTPFGNDDLIVCYAESRDGIHWERPELGLFSFRGSRRNNIIWSGRGSHGFAPFIDSRPGCLPEERFKAFGRSRVRDPGTGELWRCLFLSVSADGIRWRPVDGPKRFGSALDRDDGHFDSQNTAFWDERAQCYRIYFRSRRPVSDRSDLVGRDDGEGGRSRKAEVRDTRTAISDDLLHWRDSRLLEYPGSPLEELYTNQVQPYPRAPQFYLGFPTRYVENRGPLTDDHRVMMEKRPGRYFQSYTDGLFMSSRDGMTFRRWGEAFLRPGMPEETRWGYGECYQSVGLLETPAEVPGAPNDLSFFATEGRRHADFADSALSYRCIRRYTIRPDGFVSARAPLSGGEVTTRTILAGGDRLLLNLQTSAAGSVRVEVRNEAGDPLPGRALNDGPELFGNALEREVVWPAAQGTITDRPIRLRFVLRDADLFSFRFAAAN